MHSQLFKIILLIWDAASPYIQLHGNQPGLRSACLHAVQQSLNKITTVPHRRCAQRLIVAYAIQFMCLGTASRYGDSSSNGMQLCTPYALPAPHPICAKTFPPMSMTLSCLFFPPLCQTRKSSGVSQWGHQCLCILCRNSGVNSRPA